MRKIIDRTFVFDLSVDAWISSIEIEAESYDDALEELYQMTLEELIEKGYVKSFDLKNIDYEVEGADMLYLDGEDLEELISERIPKYQADDITDFEDLLEKLEDDASDENISFSWIEARKVLKAYLEEQKEKVDD